MVYCPSRKAGWLLPSLALFACEDLSRFSTAYGEAYCGQIGLSGAIRAGFSPRVEMRLTLDASRLDTLLSPGGLSTYEEARDEEPERRLFDKAPLSPIRPLLHDSLSELSFGEDRERNAIFTVSPTDPTETPMFAILSLRSDDNVEVRLMRPGAEDASVSNGPSARFGLFSLSRQKSQCGF